MISDVFHKFNQKRKIVLLWIRKRVTFKPNQKCFTRIDSEMKILIYFILALFVCSSKEIKALAKSFEKFLPGFFLFLFILLISTKSDFRKWVSKAFSSGIGSIKGKYFDFLYWVLLPIKEMKNNSKILCSIHENITNIYSFLSRRKKKTTFWLIYGSSGKETSKL